MLASARIRRPPRSTPLYSSAAPGGGTDASARIIAKYLTEKIGQNVQVLNRPGAAGIVAMNYVKSVPADGYIAHYSTGFILANHLIGLSKESWEEMLRPVAITGDLTNSVIVARKEVPINTFKELKERKDLSLVFAVEAGTVAEGLAVAINNETGGRMNIVPFGSASARMMGVLGGNADLALKDPRVAKDYEILGETPVFRSGREAYSELKATEKVTYEINKLIAKK